MGTSSKGSLDAFPQGSNYSHIRPSGHKWQNLKPFWYMRPQCFSTMTPVSTWDSSFKTKQARSRIEPYTLNNAGPQKCAAVIGILFYISLPAPASKP